MVIMDCTLRDGANVVGDGFSRELTQVMLDGLTAARVPIIEMGNAKGLGAYEISGARAALTDLEYMELAQPYLGRAQVGMFLNASRFRSENVAAAGEHGLSFLRVGSAAGDGKKTEEVIACVKEHGMKAFYSQMKAYLLTPEELAEEAALLESFGADEITIMDSAGTMVPEETARYVAALKEKVRVPVGFHGHNNLGMAAANALAAYQAGADIIDCGAAGEIRPSGRGRFLRAAPLPGPDAHPPHGEGGLSSGHPAAGPCLRADRRPFQLWKALQGRGGGEAGGPVPADRRGVRAGPEKPQRGADAADRRPALKILPDTTRGRDRAAVPARFCTAVEPSTQNLERPVCTKVFLCFLQCVVKCAMLLVCVCARSQNPVGRKRRRGGNR